MSSVIDISARFSAMGFETKNETVVKFMHGKNIMMSCGEYKGYTGFIYEYFPMRVNFEVEEVVYVFANKCGDKKLGDFIGDSVIVDKIGKMYCIQSGNGEIRLPTDYYVRIVCFKDNGVLKVGKVVNISCNVVESGFMIGDKEYDHKQYDHIYELCVYNLEYGTDGDIEGLLSQAIDNEASCNFVEERCFVGVNGISMDVYMVTKGEYAGKYGKLTREIDEQYVLLKKKTMIVNKNLVDINGDIVSVKKGMNKGASGKLVNIEGSCLYIQLDSIGRWITSHVVNVKNENINKKISPDDVFYMDLLLKNGNYMNVNSIVNRNGVYVYKGIERNSLEMKQVEIDESDIDKKMPGFLVKKNMVYDMEQYVETDVETDIEQLIMDSNNEVENKEMVMDENDAYGGKDDDEDDEENMECSYDEDEMNDHSEEVVVNDETKEKATFKDVERTGSMTEGFTKDEKTYLKLIKKCSEICGEISNEYTIMENVKNAIKKCNIVKAFDAKYIVSYFVLCDIVKNGYCLKAVSFDENVKKLYSREFFNKNSITGSVFLNGEDDNVVKRLRKSGEYCDIVMKMMKNCKIVIQEWYGVVDFENVKMMELIPIKRNEKNDYKKTFLTTVDLLNGNVFDGARKIIRGKDVQRLVKQWVDMIAKSNCDIVDEKSKMICDFVINNFENAPFVLKTLKESSDDMDQLKYDELKRVHDIFVAKLKNYMKMKMEIKNEKVNEMVQENKRVMKRRLDAEDEKLKKRVSMENVYEKMSAMTL